MDVHHPERFVIAVLGAGFGGLALTHRLAQSGIDDVVLFERDDGVGGTWRANSYPGAACDVPSHLYSLSFAPNPGWSRTFAPQPEILRYVEDCYDRFDVRRKVRLGTDIVALSWDEPQGRWQLVDSQGHSYEADVVISAVGMFHTPLTPELPGIETFAGVTFHSARWKHEHDLTDRRVAVVGTGASAIQIVPAIAGHAARVDLYQRSAPWILPRDDRPFSDEEKRAFATEPEVAARYRQGLHDAFEKTTLFLADDPKREELAAAARGYLAQEVPDPQLREKLSPAYPFGCKRILISSDYYAALQRDDVELVTSQVERVTPRGICTADGIERPCDTIVWCTGFRASEYLRGIDVLGREGKSIHDRWAGVPRAYHGLCVPGFPNFFMLYGPNTNQGGNSILLILEAQAQFVASALEAMQVTGASRIEVRPEAMDAYVSELEASLASTIWTSDRCHSYFQNAGGDVVTQLPHTAGWYRAVTNEMIHGDFELGGEDRRVPIPPGSED